MSSIVVVGDTAHTPSTGRRRVVAALMLVMALAAMDSTVISTCIPQIVSDLGGFAYFGWLFAGYLLAVTVMLPVYGKLADIFGRKQVLIVGVVVFLLGSGLCSATWSMASLIAFRVLQGLGGGAIQGLVQTIAGDLYTKQERGKIQAALSPVWVSAALAGPALGGIFVTYLSWRWVFLVNLPLGIFALARVIRHLPDDRTRRTGVRIDWLGAIGVFAATGLFLVALTQLGTTSWRSAGVLTPLAGAAVSCLATVLIESRAAQPIIPGWVWRRPVIAAANIAMFALGVVATAPALILPTYGQAVLRLSPVEAGFLLAVLMVSWPLSAAFVNRAYLRIGFRDTALFGVGGAVIATLLFALLPVRPLWQPAAIMLLLGVALGFFQPPLIVGVQSTVNWGERATATSSIVFWRQLGQSSSAALFGAIVNDSLNAQRSLRGQVNVSASTGAFSSVLGHRQSAGSPIAQALSHAIATAASHIFLAAAAAGLIAFGTLLFLAPRQFPAPEVGEDR